MRAERPCTFCRRVTVHDAAGYCQNCNSRPASTPDAPTPRDPLDALLDDMERRGHAVFYGDDDATGRR